jgi:hypothetical protein
MVQLKWLLSFSFVRITGKYSMPGAAYAELFLKNAKAPAGCLLRGLL